MIVDIAAMRSLHSVTASISTIHHAHQRGARITLDGRAGEPWTLTVDATHLGGRLWVGSHASLTAVLLMASVHILADCPDWRPIAAAAEAAKRAEQPS